MILDNEKSVCSSYAPAVAAAAHLVDLGIPAIIGRPCVTRCASA
jgi:hypothetical protein